MTENRGVTASRVVAARPEDVFAVISDPRRHPEMDGRGNTSAAQQAARVMTVGESFLMLNSNGKVRQNRVVEFDQGHVVAWMPCPVDGEPFGFRWRWQVEQHPEGTLVIHSYDWTELTRQDLVEEARTVGVADLERSLARLAALVEQPGAGPDLT